MHIASPPTGGEPLRGVAVLSEVSRRLPKITQRDRIAQGRASPTLWGTPKQSWNLGTYWVVRGSRLLPPDRAAEFKKAAPLQAVGRTTCLRWYLLPFPLPGPKSRDH
jgi:hypothetical protein